MLGHALIGLPQPYRVLARQAVQSLERRVYELGVGREGDGLGHSVVSTVTRSRSLVRNAPLSCATRRLSAMKSSSLSPSRFLQWLRSERSCGKVCWKNSLSSKIDVCGIVVNSAGRISPGLRQRLCHPYIATCRSPSFLYGL